MAGTNVRCSRIKRWTSPMRPRLHPVGVFGNTFFIFDRDVKSSDPQHLGSNSQHLGSNSIISFAFFTLITSEVLAVPRMDRLLPRLASSVGRTCVGCHRTRVLFSCCISISRATHWPCESVHQANICQAVFFLVVSIFFSFSFM